jgi:predicted transcriptional regulator
MAISNELSSDVAVAIMAKKKSPQELQQLKEVILQVHSALQEMSEETRSDRLSRSSHKKTQKAQNDG